MINRKGSILFAIIAICSFFTLLNAPVVSAASKAHPSLYRSNRVMGMGGANVAVGGTFESVFSNPAGIAKMPEGNWEVNIIRLNGELGENVYDFATDMMDAFDENEDDELNAINEVLAQYKGKNMHFTISDLTSIAKNSGKLAFGMGGVASFDSNSVAHQGIGTDGFFEVQANIKYGAIGGMSYQVKDDLYVGASLKLIHNESIDHLFTINEIIENEVEIGDYIVDDLREEGNAVGVDLGVLYDVTQFEKLSKLNPTVGLSLLNIGDLDFGDAGKIPMTVNIGASIRPEFEKFKLPLVIGLDYVDLFSNYEEDSDIAKRIRLGAELGLVDKTVFSFLVRAGLYQGYPTLGADLRLFLATLSYTTYAEEVGAYAGQDEDRRHMVSLTVGW